MINKILMTMKEKEDERMRIEKNAYELIEVRSQMLDCAEGIRVLLDKAIRFLLDEDDPLEIDILKMLRAASDLSNLQRRLRVLSRERAELKKGEEA